MTEIARFTESSYADQPSGRALEAGGRGEDLRGVGVAGVGVGGVQEQDVQREAPQRRFLCHGRRPSEVAHVQVPQQPLWQTGPTSHTPAMSRSSEHLRWEAALMVHTAAASRRIDQFHADHAAAGATGRESDMCYPAQELNLATPATTICLTHAAPEPAKELPEGCASLDLMQVSRKKAARDRGSWAAAASPARRLAQHQGQAARGGPRRGT